MFKKTAHLDAFLMAKKEIGCASVEQWLINVKLVGG